MELHEAIRNIEAELKRATDLHPFWPDDIIHAVSIMNEESGESIRAALDHVYAGCSIEHLRKELIQTGAMVLRCLLSMREQ